MIAEPPAVYDAPYGGSLIEIVSSQAVFDNCNGAIACAIRVRFPSPMCVVVLPEKLAAAAIEQLRRHERAHCNGWPAGHPG